jgi:hypothetical protein
MFAFVTAFRGLRNTRTKNDDPCRTVTSSPPGGRRSYVVNNQVWNISACGLELINQKRQSRLGEWILQNKNKTRNKGK